MEEERGSLDTWEGRGYNSSPLALSLVPLEKLEGGVIDGDGNNGSPPGGKGGQGP